jgi:hypothetical protein
VKTFLVLCVALAVLQGCSGMDVKPPDEFGYRRTFHPAG